VWPLTSLLPYAVKQTLPSQIPQLPPPDRRLSARPHAVLIPPLQQPHPQPCDEMEELIIILMPLHKSPTTAPIPFAIRRDFHAKLRYKAHRTPPAHSLPIFTPPIELAAAVTPASAIELEPRRPAVLLPPRSLSAIPTHEPPPIHRRLRFHRW
jgi:hypothetical protein